MRNSDLHSSFLLSDSFYLSGDHFKALDLEKSQVIFDEMKYSYELVLFWFFVY